MIRGLNHITLAVKNLEASRQFYEDILGGTLKAIWPKGCYFELGNIWLALILDPELEGLPRADYSHLAWHVDPVDFEALAHKIKGSGAVIWQENHSEGDSLYFLDPSQHKLEIHSSDLTQRLKTALTQPWEGFEVIQPSP